jgi:hypothetical protein
MNTQPTNIKSNSENGDGLETQPNKHTLLNLDLDFINSCWLYNYLLKTQVYAYNTTVSSGKNNSKIPCHHL